MSDDAITIDTLKLMIIKSLNLEGVTPDMIDADAPLFGGGLGLDSVDALELVITLEKTLGIKIRSEEVDPETFGTVNRILEFILSRRTAE